ncbi:MAG: hypothetical protein JNL74_07535 [Fibrobacteres bacterium]|nr:hypothetical protein [Fibrobacterota bacterium]
MSYLHQLTLALLLLPILVSSAINIPITVKDGASAGNETGVPVKIGVPLPKGTMDDITTLRVTDAAGNTVPAQFSVLGRWWPNSSSIRVVLVQFAADVISAGRTQYYLKDDGTGNSAVGLTYTETSDRFTVNAGKLKFEVKKTKFNIIDNLWFDVNNNGTFETAEQMIMASDNNGALLVDTNGASFRDTSKSALTFQVEESGPVRFVLRVESPTEASANGWGFLVRITAHLNKPYVELDYYLKNSAYGATGHHLNFSSFSLVNKINNLGTATVRLGGVLADNAGAYEGALGSTSAIVQSTAWRKFTVNGSLQTNLCVGYADISDGSKGVMAVVRKFSNLWPTALEVTSDKKLSVNLWPAGRKHRLVDQTRRAHQIMLYFHGAATQAELFKQAKLFQRYPVPALKPAVYAAAHAIGDYGGIYQADTTWNESMYTPAVINVGDSNYTGWWNWGGDHARRNSSGYGVWPFQATTYISCGSPEAFYYLDDRSRHNAEMRPMWMDGYKSQVELGMLNIDYPPAVGMRPPNANYDNTTWSSWDYMHTWLYEMNDYYFFSGEKFCAENMRMVADFIMQGWTRYLYTTETFARHQGEPIQVIFGVYKMTGDVKYLNFLIQYAKWVVDNYTSKYGVFARSTFQQCLFANLSFDLYFILPENTPAEREFKERYLLMLEGANNGQVYWGGNVFKSDAGAGYQNSWGFSYQWENDPYTRPDGASYYTSYMMNQIGMIYFLMGDPVYRNATKLMCVPYYGTAPVNVTSRSMDNIISNNQSTGSYFRVSSAAWYDTAAKKALPLPQISTVKAASSAAKKVTLNWTSVGGTAYRIHYATKPIVERFSPIGDGTTMYPHPDTNANVTNLYKCLAIDANFTPKTAGQTETFTVGPFPDSLVGKKIYFNIQAVNIVSEIDQYRSPLSNIDSIVLVSSGTDNSTNVTNPDFFGIREVHAMNSGEIMVSITDPVRIDGLNFGVSLQSITTKSFLTVTSVEVDTACKTLFRVKTSGLIEGKDYRVQISGLSPLSKSASDTLSASYIFMAGFGPNKYSVRKFNFGSAYSENGYEGDHIFNGSSGWGVYLTGGCGYYTPVTSRDDLSGTPADPAKYSMSVITCGSRYWFKMLVSKDIKDYRLKVCSGRGNYAPDSVLLFVEGVPVWNKEACAAAGKQWIYLDSIPIRIEDGMLDIDWSQLCYVNLWPVFNFKNVTFHVNNTEKVKVSESNKAFVQVAPNPFNPLTRISFSIGKAGNIAGNANPKIAIFDVRGRFVADLTPPRMVEGQIYQAEWNARDASATRTASQVYIVRLIVGNHVINKKMILLK